MTTTLMTDAVDHHIWATLRLLDALDQLDDAQLASSVPGTYGSILDTIRHMVASDAGYASLLAGGRVARIEDDEEETLDLAALREIMQRNAEAWNELLASAPDPDEMVVRHRDDGSETHAPVSIRLAQVVHHGTDHRSQICTALTALGIEPPPIDVWDYAEAAARRVEVEPPAG